MVKKCFPYVKKSNCGCYYADRFGCTFKKSCNFPICRFYTTQKPEKPIKSYKEYLKIRHALADRRVDEEQKIAFLKSGWKNK